MITAVVHLLVVLALLVAPGYLPALALSRDRATALVTAPLATAVVCSVAGVVATATRSSFLLWVIVAVAGAQLLAARLRPELTDGPGRWHVLPWAAAAVAVMLLAVRRAPTDWDARSIWLFHAQWFWSGGRAVSDALGNSALVFSQPDYPPLIPATVGAVWSLTGFDLEIGQWVVSLLSASALLAIVVALDRVSRRLVGGDDRLRPIVAGCVVLGAVGIAQENATNGYGDLVWSAAFVAGALLLLFGRRDPATVGVGLLALAAGMLTKNEGMLAGLAVLAIATLRVLAPRPRDFRAVVPLAIAFVPSALWAVVARRAGAESYLATSGHVEGLLRLDADVTSRLDPTLAAFWHLSHAEVIVAALAGVAMLLVARRSERRSAAVRLLVAWAVFAVLVASIVLAYLISPYDLGWQLGTSIDRTTIAPRLWALAQVALLVGVLGTRLWQALTDDADAASSSAPDAATV